MKVSGFTFVRNAIKYDYPVVEAIRSILPICDEVVVAVGNSEDGTLSLIQSIDSPKIRIIETVWDDSLREGGRVLAEETNKAFAALAADSDWAFYIQGDEAVHEQYLLTIKAAMEKYKDAPEVDGLLFNYKHFYGSYDYVGESTRWYRREIRVVKNRKDIYSYKDAQGFRKGDNQKLNVKPIDAYIYHYGWVRDPRAMQDKRESFLRLYHSNEWMETHVPKVAEFDYSGVDALGLFDGTHPAIMQDRIDRINWKFDYDLSYRKFSFKDRIRMFVESLTGYRLWEYKNYKII